MHGYCWGRKVPILEIRATRKQLTFDKVTATAKRKEWNKALEAFVLPEHKPQTLPKDLTQVPDSQSIFGGSDPSYVFSSQSRNKITSHVKELAKTNAKPAVSKRKHPANGRVI